MEFSEAPVAIEPLVNREDFELYFPLIQELRPHLQYADFLDLYDFAHEADGYELVGLQSNGKPLAVMGYRVLADFLRGHHLYIDDLVTTASARSSGYGARLLQYAEEVARRKGLPSLRLATGIENERGRKFYETNGWKARSVAYVRSL
jgi:GNAT superfamily N-acetyltransferase